VPGECASASAACDTLLLAPGTCSRDLQPAPAEFLQTRHSVPVAAVLDGATGNPDDVVLDGQGHGRVVTCVEGLGGLVVRDLTIANVNTTANRLSHR